MEALDTLGKRVLAAFDELGRERLDLHALLETAGGKKPENREAVVDAVQQLAERGLVRAEGGDFYTRTEDGRLAIAGPRDVTLYTRKNCHLCEEAKAAIAPLLREFGAVLCEVNIDDDPVLKERYGRDIPVILIGQRKAAKHRVDVAQFRRQLEEAIAK